MIGTEIAHISQSWNWPQCCAVLYLSPKLQIVFGGGISGPDMFRRTEIMVWKSGRTIFFNPTKPNKGSKKKKKKWMDLVQLTWKPPPPRPPKHGLCFFSPLFYRSFPIFWHNFYIKSKKKNVQKWTRPETPPPPLWTKSIQMFFFFFNFPNIMEFISFFSPMSRLYIFRKTN